MRKSIYIFVFLLFAIGIGMLFYFSKIKGAKNKDNNSLNQSENNMSQTYMAQKISTDNDDKNNNSNTLQTEEKELSSFTTTIHKDTKSRYSNIKLASSTLNDTIVKANSKFSLWDILGNPTKEKGYEKAKTFTSDGKIVRSYGGGICQISTTLYNAVLKVEGLDVTERHEHSRDVNYIKDGKDASVSYNSADFRFNNTLEFDIKIKAEVNENKLTIKIEKV